MTSIIAEELTFGYCTILGFNIWVTYDGVVREHYPLPTTSPGVLDPNVVEHKMVKRISGIDVLTIRNLNNDVKRSDKEYLQEVLKVLNNCEVETLILENFILETPQDKFRTFVKGLRLTNLLMENCSTVGGNNGFLESIEFFRHIPGTLDLDLEQNPEEPLPIFSDQFLRERLQSSKPRKRFKLNNIATSFTLPAVFKAIEFCFYNRLQVDWHFGYLMSCSNELREFEKSFISVQAHVPKEVEMTMKVKEVEMNKIGDVKYYEYMFEPPDKSSTFAFIAHFEATPASIELQRRNIEMRDNERGKPSSSRETSSKINRRKKCNSK